jgi:hypothetical protein
VQITDIFEGFQHELEQQAEQVLFLGPFFFGTLCRSNCGSCSPQAFDDDISSLCAEVVTEALCEEQVAAEEKSEREAQELGEQLAEQEQQLVAQYIAELLDSVRSEYLPF